MAAAVASRYVAGMGPCSPRGSFCATSAGTARGRSPKGHSPKSSPSPEESRSPSGGPRQRPQPIQLQQGCARALSGGPSRNHVRSGQQYGSPPRAASPFNPHTDFDILFDLPQGIEWHRFEAQVGVADWAAGSWATSSRARFLLIDDDTQEVLWESSDALEPWSPTELCSVILSWGAAHAASAGAVDNIGTANAACPSAPAPHHICLRVRCSEPPEGALWIEPTVTALRPHAATGSSGTGCLRGMVAYGRSGSPSSAVASGCCRGNKDAGQEEDLDAVATSSLGSPGSTQNKAVSGWPSIQPWQELLAGELALEIVARLQCRDVARLLNACGFESAMQQLMWHFTFAHNFQAVYSHYFLRPLQGQPRPAALPAPQYWGSPRGSGANTRGSPRGSFGHGAHGGSSPHRTAGGELDLGSSGLQLPPMPPMPRGRASHGSLAPTLPPAVRPTTRGLAVSPAPKRPAARPARERQITSGARAHASTGSAVARVAASAEGFVPLWAVEVFDWRQICRRFFLSTCLCTSVNFQLFNGMTPPGFVKDSGETLHAPRGPYGQSLALRCGWNVPLGTEHFLSCPSAVVAHRSPLGVTGIPPSVATVRGTAGPEPLAMTPMVSEKDSSVMLPAAPSNQHVRPQWTVEVDPGQYLVVATVGDRHVGFSAYLEVCGQPLFCGDWIEAGNFKTRCLLCVTLRGAITVGPHWPRGTAGLRDHREDFARSVDPAMLGEVPVGVRHDSPASPRGGVSPPRPTNRSELLVRGTRLVSLRVVAACLAREVEREKCAAFSEVNQKLAEARARVELVQQAIELRGFGPSLERELARAQAKMADIHVQKALKLFSMIAISKRITHPYIYPNGEVASVPPVGQPPDLERLMQM